MADWDEIKRLAADFQRVQESETLQRLTERNCIDIVKKLTELNLIELVYTCDGKGLVTTDYLLKEIQDEVHVNGGRMAIHDLAARLDVDYQHVEHRAKELSSDYNLVSGQIIHSNYKETVGKQIADIMLIDGELSIADFAKRLDLPPDILLPIVEEMLPKVLEDHIVSQDRMTYYTTEIMDKYKSIIAGSLTAITKPTNILPIMKRHDIPERVYGPIVERLLKDGRIDAVIENRILTPSVFVREQNEYIYNFYKQNSYIGYDVLSRSNIKQPKLFLKKKFPDGIQLNSCFISPDLVSQVEGLIEETITTDGFIDITTIVPTVLDDDDIEIVIQDIFKKNKEFETSAMIFDKTTVCSLKYISKCKESFDKLLEPKAQEHLKQGKLLDFFYDGKEPIKTESSAKVEEDTTESKVADQKIPEVCETPRDKGKKGKESGKKGKPAKKFEEDDDDDDDDEPVKGKSKKPRGRAAKRALTPPKKSKKGPLIFMSENELMEKLQADMRYSEDASDELCESIAKVIYDDLNASYFKVAKKVIDEYIKEKELELAIALAREQAEKAEVSSNQGADNPCSTNNPE